MSDQPTAEKINELISLQSQTERSLVGLQSLVQKQNNRIDKLSRRLDLLLRELTEAPILDEVRAKILRRELEKLDP